MNELLTRGIGHTEFKDSPVGRIPKSWEVKTVRSVTNCNYWNYALFGHSFKKSSIKLSSLVSVNYIKNGIIDGANRSESLSLLNVKHIEFSRQDYIFKKEWILMEMCNSRGNELVQMAILVIKIF